jgi:lysophospholipase L1-like esterase
LGKDQKTKEIVFIIKKALIIISVTVNVLVVFAGLGAWSIKDQLLWGMTWAHAERQRTQFDLLGEREVDVVFYGDSLTEGGRWDELFPNVRVANRGISGDTTEDLIKRLDQVADLNPKKLFVMIGINDVNRSIEENVTKLNYKHLFDSINSKLPNTDVYVQSVLPVNDKWMMADNSALKGLNDELENISNQYGYTYIDLRQHFTNDDGKLSQKLSNDGIHLLGEGYLLWKYAIEKHVNE